MSFRLDHRKLDRWAFYSPLIRSLYVVSRTYYASHSMNLQMRYQESPCFRPLLLDLMLGPKVTALAALRILNDNIQRLQIFIIFHHIPLLVRVRKKNGVSSFRIICFLPHWKDVTFLLDPNMQHSVCILPEVFDSFTKLRTISINAIPREGPIELLQAPELP